MNSGPERFLSSAVGTADRRRIAEVREPALSLLPCDLRISPVCTPPCTFKSPESIFDAGLAPILPIFTLALFFRCLHWPEPP